MKIKILLLIVFLPHIFLPQIGINNNVPKATLDIMAKTNDASRPEGVIAPRLTGDQIKAADSLYGAEQMGTIIYITAAVTMASPKTTNINAAGYYFFDGNIWRKFKEEILTGTTFVPYVVASGQTSNSVIINDYTGFNRLIFNVLVNDGNWNVTNNYYKVPKAGFYRVSFQAVMQPTTTQNSFAWRLRYSPPSSIYTFATLGNAAINQSYHKGGIIIMYFAKDTILELGGSPCSGCSSKYNVTTRSFSITYLGGG